MGVIYDLPRIGAEADGFQQKGPTCWYYASKMLLKFHDKLSDKSSKTYQEFKRLHQIRRGLTALGGQERSLRSDKGEVQAAMKALIKELPMQIDQPSPYATHVKKIYDYLASGNAKINEVILMLDRLDEDWSTRLSLLSGFVPTAGFTKLDPADVFKSTATLETALHTFGPMYAGGALSIAAKTKKNPEPTQDQKEFAKVLGVPVLVEEFSLDRAATYKVGKVQSSGDELLEVIELKGGSAHAVAICGVDGEAVYYKDPNGSHKLLSHPFDKFATNVKSLITLKCDNCTHKSKTLMLKT